MENYIITNTVLTETINLVIKRLNRNTKAINEVYETITSEFTIIYENKELIQRSIETLIRYKATFGLADALSIEVMKELNIYEIFSFDDDFDNKERIVWVH
ncbi:hypothetical protein MBCUT_08270 [Methanobrevibacter cuticularis]|uniref:PIN domain-containing protein n=1 Tax=Methanobrevibacter cuticularis TaxID=47311 RepID=A0A166EA91_9EURY|nr:PIN domain-containing protein [Methanobrevibacter cuticularis]KZX16441.1 hypothetical protein MBCUT_08270 [Methanobrevibacter cuticularis]